MGMSMLRNHRADSQPHLKGAEGIVVDYVVAQETLGETEKWEQGN